DAFEQGADAGRAGKAFHLEARVRDSGQPGAGGTDAIHGTTWSMRTTRPVAPGVPGATGLLTPKRSPATGAASPLALMRTSTTTSGASDSWRWASIDSASPSANLPSNCASGSRVAAKGMREPEGARALTKT